MKQTRSGEDDWNCCPASEYIGGPHDRHKELCPPQTVHLPTERQCRAGGDEAGYSDVACLLVGLGIRERSLSSRRGAAVRQALPGINSQRTKEIADRAVRCRTPGEVRERFAPLRSSEAIIAPSK
jgi:hypothetical protein